MDQAKDLFRRFSPRDHRSDKHQTVSPQNTHNSHIRMPSVQGATQGMPPAYAVQGGPSRQGNAPHWDSHSRHEGAHPGGVRQPGGITSPSTGNYPISQTNSFSQYAQPTNAKQIEARNWFIAIDQDGNGELDPEELCSALLTNGYTRFKADTVKYLMNTFDQDSNGVITFDEFEPLWNYMNQWIQMFDSFDVNQDGIISTAELGHALANYGFHLAPDVLDLVMEKYGDAPLRNRQQGYGSLPGPRMNLDNFVSACVGVRKMCDLHRDCSPQGQPRISRDNFLKAVLSLP